MKFGGNITESWQENRQTVRSSAQRTLWEDSLYKLSRNGLKVNIGRRTWGKVESRGCGNDDKILVEKEIIDSVVQSSVEVTEPSLLRKR